MVLRAPVKAHRLKGLLLAFKGGVFVSGTQTMTSLWQDVGFCAYIRYFIMIWLGSSLNLLGSSLNKIWLFYRLKLAVSNAKRAL